ncbi:MAG: SMC-Scp complex subunit ScpB [Coriobacteriales bacterium]|nr:SMC-Scp complex subunit ScpB [Coriobacteriales bacterium]
MIDPKEETRLKGTLEALLFVSDEPVTSARLASILELPIADTDSLLSQMATDYQEQERGFQLREVAGGWRFFTHPAYHEVIEKYVLSWDTRKLSQAALEALAVIAYHQPVTRNHVNAIRGVNSEAVISSLVEKGLVREVGRDEGTGSAILYGTTRTFLEKFGLKGLTELPPLEDFAPDEESRKFIRERLTAGSLSAEVEQETLDDLEDVIDDDEQQEQQS